MWVSDMITLHNGLYEINFDLTYNVHTCGSDHRSFWSNGYTAIMTHEQIHGPAHSPNDTADKVSTLYTRKNGQLGMSALAKLAEVQSIPAHDVTITSVGSSKSVIGRGFALSVNLAIQNEGTYSETFNVTTYANTQSLNQTKMILTAGTFTTFSVTSNTTSWAYGTYVISAYAEIVPGENETADNNRTCNVPVHVGVLGDISGATRGVYDGKVDMRDIAYSVLLFNTRPSSSNWDPNADINGDDVVNVRDIQIAILNFNKHE